MAKKLNIYIDSIQDEFYSNSIEHLLVPFDPTRDYVMMNIEIERLNNIILHLSTKERYLLNAIYFEGLSDRAYATKIGAKQTTISKNHRNLLIKLRNLLNK